MKTSFFVLFAFLLAFTHVHAQVVKLEALQVGRYTRQGAEDVLVESGFLSVKSKSFESSSGALYSEASLGIPANVLSTINGKFVAFKATIDTQMSINGFLDNYSFSKNAYPVVGGDAYIVTFATGEDATAPSVSIKLDKSNITEGLGAEVKATITLDKATKTDISVRYKILGDAKNTSDYRVSGPNGNLRIKKGQKSGSIIVVIVDNKVKESTETLKINLLAGTAYKLGKLKTAGLKISDND